MTIGAGCLWHLSVRRGRLLFVISPRLRALLCFSLPHALHKLSHARRFAVLGAQPALAASLQVKGLLLPRSRDGPLWELAFSFAEVAMSANLGKVRKVPFAPDPPQKTRRMVIAHHSVRLEDVFRRPWLYAGPLPKPRLSHARAFDLVQRLSFRPAPLLCECPECCLWASFTLEGRMVGLLALLLRNHGCVCSPSRTNPCLRLLDGV